MKIIASYNIKGGVGKTAAAVNMGYLAALEGYSTLIWDLDPQGAATFYFRVKPRVKGGGKKLLKGKKSLMEFVKGTDFENLDLLPADFSYRHMDIELEAKKNPEKKLSSALKQLSDTYDFIILDCPPSVSLVSEAVFMASDSLVVPIIPTTLSLRTLNQLFAFRDETGLDKLSILPFFSMVDRRKSLHREIVEKLPLQCPETLKTTIPYSSEVERMGLRREPLVHYAPKSKAATAYADLWGEVRDCNS